MCVIHFYNSFRYSMCQLIEVNAHSLFSKWFSESGKLVCLFCANRKTVICMRWFICWMLSSNDTWACAWFCMWWLLFLWFISTFLYWTLPGIISQWIYIFICILNSVYSEQSFFLGGQTFPEDPGDGGRRKQPGICIDRYVSTSLSSDKLTLYIGN